MRVYKYKERVLLKPFLKGRSYLRFLVIAFFNPLSVIYLYLKPKDRVCSEPLLLIYRKVYIATTEKLIYTLNINEDMEVK